MNFLFIELIELHVILLNSNMHIALIMKHAGRTLKKNNLKISELRGGHSVVVVLYGKINK